MNEAPNELELHKRTYSYVTLFKMYVTSGVSKLYLITTFVVLVLAQAATSGCDYWLEQWTNLEDQRANKTLNKRDANNSSGEHESSFIRCRITGSKYVYRRTFEFL